MPRTWRVANMTNKWQNCRTTLPLSGYVARQCGFLPPPVRRKVIYALDDFSFSTMASITAMAVMVTTSRTLVSKSVKWIGLFNPI